MEINKVSGLLKMKYCKVKVKKIDECDNKYYKAFVGRQKREEKHAKSRAQNSKNDSIKKRKRSQPSSEKSDKDAVKREKAAKSGRRKEKVKKVDECNNEYYKLSIGQHKRVEKHAEKRTQNSKNDSIKERKLSHPPSYDYVKSNANAVKKQNATKSIDTTMSKSMDLSDHIFGNLFAPPKTSKLIKGTKTGNRIQKSKLSFKAPARMIKKYVSHRKTDHPMNKKDATDKHLLDINST